MYRPPLNHTALEDSLRRLSSTNPFRRGSQPLPSLEPPRPPPLRTYLSNLVGSSGSNFNDWVRNNRDLLLSSDDEDTDLLGISRNYHSGSNSNSITHKMPQPAFMNHSMRSGSDPQYSEYVSFILFSISCNPCHQAFVFPRGWTSSLFLDLSLADVRIRCDRVVSTVISNTIRFCVTTDEGATQLNHFPREIWL